MTDTWVTPRVWVAGEKVTASKKNEDSNNFRVLWPYTATGDIAYKDGAGAYLSKVALTVGGVLYGGAAAPAYLAAGAANTFLRSTGSAPAYAPLVAKRQGGSSTNWSSPGTTTYTPTGTIMQVGMIPITFAASTGEFVAVTYPTAFTQNPAIFVSAECIYNMAYSWSIGYTQAASPTTGFNLNVKWASAYTGTINFSWLAIGL